jgi:hypothetical protein
MLKRSFALFPIRHGASVEGVSVWSAGAQVRMLGAPWAKIYGRLSDAGFESNAGAATVGKTFAWERAYKQCDDDSAKKHGDVLQPEYEDTATTGSKMKSKQFIKFYYSNTFSDSFCEILAMSLLSKASQVTA